jgi:hypothetical protein
MRHQDLAAVGSGRRARHPPEQQDAGQALGGSVEPEGRAEPRRRRAVSAARASVTRREAGAASAVSRTRSHDRARPSRARRWARSAVRTRRFEGVLDDVQRHEHQVVLGAQQQRRPAGDVAGSRARRRGRRGRRGRRVARLGPARRPADRCAGPRGPRRARMTGPGRSARSPRRVDGKVGPGGRRGPDQKIVILEGARAPASL